jgi:thiol-disulfide isomerase/thioredoxin
MVDLVALEAGREGGDPDGALARLKERYGDIEAVWSFAREHEAALMLELAGIPAFEAVDLEGRPFGSEALAGKLALLDFWATWCPPCVEQIPELAALHRRRGIDPRFVLLGISLDAKENLDDDGFRLWLRQRGVDWPQIRDGLADDSPIARAFGIDTLPFQVLVGPDGSVLAAGPRVPLHRVEAALAGP